MGHEMSDNDHGDGGDPTGGDSTGDAYDDYAYDDYAYYGPFGPGAPLAGDEGWQQDATYEWPQYGPGPDEQPQPFGPGPDGRQPFGPGPYAQDPASRSSYASGPDPAANTNISSRDLDDTQPIPVQAVDARAADARAGEVRAGDTQPIDLAEQPDAGSRFPAPPGVPPLRPRPPTDPAGAPLSPPAGPAPKRQRHRGAAVLAMATIIALIVGSAAGYGGALLAGVGPTDTETATAPRQTGATDPSRSPVAPPPPQADTVAIAKKVLPSTVTIQVGDRTSGGSTGSGFVLDRDGRIMTNNHVVAQADGSTPFRVTFSDGRRAEAKVLGRSPSYDLAVIKVAADEGLVPLAIGDSAATKVGEPVIAVGSPLGLGGTVTEGIISARDRPVVVGGDEDADNSSAYINGLQTDAPINPGNSGGPLVDAGGRVIGVNSAILTVGRSDGGQGGNIGLGFAIPINQAMVIGEMLIKDGKATYPVIGATVSSQSDDSGVRLANVEPNGPAAKAGLRPDDIITGIDGAPVARAENLIVTIRTHRPGDQITLTYQRGGRSAEVKVTLDGKEG